MNAGQLVARRGKTSDGRRRGGLLLWLRVGALALLIANVGLLPAFAQDDDQSGSSSDATPYDPNNPFDNQLPPSPTMPAGYSYLYLGLGGDTPYVTISAPAQGLSSTLLLSGAASDIDPNSGNPLVTLSGGDPLVNGSNFVWQTSCPPTHPPIATFPTYIPPCDPEFVVPTGVPLKYLFNNPGQAFQGP